MLKTVFRRNFKIISILLIVFLSTSGFSGCRLLSKAEQEKIKPITINYWRPADDTDAFAEIIADYQSQHPNITINYRKFRLEEYEKELLNALAEDRGPDIFSIPQSWLVAYQSKIEPMPKEIQMAYQYEKGTIQKQTVVELRTKKSPTLREIKEKYVDTVFNDVVIDGKVWGLPLSLETLIMIYNKDILNQSGVSQIPTNWTEFQKAVTKTTRYETENKIIQSGTALGTGYNVDRSFDILSILMIQNGVTMVSDNKLTMFNRINKEGVKSGVNAGLEALQFYTDFAQPSKDVFCWDTSMPSSFEAFLNGKVAFFFGYNYHIPQIRSRSKVNFGLAPIPQISNTPIRNYANYSVEVVSKKSSYKSEAWDFILFMNQPDEIKKFLNKTHRPTAQRALISTQLDDEDLYPSVSQALTAVTWYKGYDIAATEKAFKDMIEQYLVLTDERKINDILNLAISKISQTFIKR